MILFNIRLALSEHRQMTLELAQLDLESRERQQVGRLTGEVSNTPPPEVRTMFIDEPATHRFVPFKVSNSRGPCRRCCCQGFGEDSHGSCRLCDREPVFQEHALVQRLNPFRGEDGSAFLLQNLLSSDECDDVIAQAEAFGLKDCGYHKQIRVTDRVVVMGEDLAALLFERSRAYLDDILIPDFGRPPVGVPKGMLKGLWQPACLNLGFRVCRYRPGGFFVPHHDDAVGESDTFRSIKTFMIYLNDDFSGGLTRFYDEKQQLYCQGQPEFLVHELRPEKGSCLVFNHHITHDGGELQAGMKYILRTEVMYKHVSNFKGGLQDSLDETDFSSEGFESDTDYLDEDLLPAP